MLGEQCEGSQACMQSTPVCLKLLIEVSESNQTPYTLTSQKGQCPVLLLADLPKLLGTHLFSFHIPFRDNNLHSLLATLKKDSFYLLSVLG